MAERDDGFPSWQLAHGGFLEKSWTEIGAYCGSVLAAQDESPPDVDPLEGVDPEEDYLGRGVWGCTYPFTTTKRFVLKLTLDPFEGPIWSKIISAGQGELLVHPGITYAAALAYVPPKRVIDYAGSEFIPAGKYTAYAIVREAIKPTTKRQRDKWEDALDEVKRSAMKVAEWGEDPRGWLTEVAELPEVFPELDEVARFMIEIYSSTGIVLADVHDENVGWARYDLSETGGGRYTRTGVESPQKKMLKIFDPGHSSLSAREKQKLEASIPVNPGVPPISHRIRALARTHNR